MGVERNQTEIHRDTEGSRIGTLHWSSGLKYLPWSHETATHCTTVVPCAVQLNIQLLIYHINQERTDI